MCGMGIVVRSIVRYGEGVSVSVSDLCFEDSQKKQAKPRLLLYVFVCLTS